MARRNFMGTLRRFIVLSVPVAGESKEWTRLLKRLEKELADGN